MKKPNKKRVLIVSVLVILCIGIWTLWGNTAIEVNEYEIVSDRIQQGFDGFRIAQVSDLHNKDFGEGYGQLLTLLSQINPDIIVVTGDLIDSRQTDLDIALEFAWQAGKIARVYFVSGNHEARVPEYEDLKIGLVKAGTVILENQKVQITREGESITIMGIDDPSFQEDYLFGDAASVTSSALSELQNESDGYTVLLSARSVYSCACLVQILIKKSDCTPYSPIFQRQRCKPLLEQFRFLWGFHAVISFSRLPCSAF